jgi:hypothetical protein
MSCPIGATSAGGAASTPLKRSSGLASIARLAHRFQRQAGIEAAGISIVTGKSWIRSHLAASGTNRKRLNPGGGLHAQAAPLQPAAENRRILFASIAGTGPMTTRCPASTQMSNCASPWSANSFICTF